MRFSKLLFLSLFLLTIAACSSSETTNINSNSNLNGNINPNVSVNFNAPKTNAATSGINTVKTPEIETKNTAETIKPLVEAYCAARRNKDEAAIRKLYTQASLQKMQKDMKAENITSIVEYLDSEPVGDQPCQVRNEEINGSQAVAEIRTATYPNGIRWAFAKENGEWKLTADSPDIK